MIYTLEARNFHIQRPQRPLPWFTDLLYLPPEFPAPVIEIVCVGGADLLQNKCDLGL